MNEHRCYSTKSSETFRWINESGEHRFDDDNDSGSSAICEFIDGDIESPSRDSMHSFYLETTCADEELSSGERVREKEYEGNENGVNFESTKSRRKRKLSYGEGKVERLWQQVSNGYAEERAKKCSLLRGWSSSSLKLDGRGNKMRERYAIGNGNRMLKRKSIPKEIRYKWKEFENENENKADNAIRRENVARKENKVGKGIGMKFGERIESLGVKEIEGQNKVRGSNDHLEKSISTAQNSADSGSNSGKTWAQRNHEKNGYRRRWQVQRSRSNLTMEKDRNTEANLLEEIKKRIDKDFEQIEIRGRSGRRFRRTKNRGSSPKEKPSDSAGTNLLRSDVIALSRSRLLRSEPMLAQDRRKVPMGSRITTYFGTRTDTTKKYDSRSVGNGKANGGFNLVENLCGDSSTRAGQGKKLTKSQIDEAVKKMIDELIHMERRSIAIPRHTSIVPLIARERQQLDEVRREDSPTRSCRTSASSRDFSQESDLSSGEEAYLANISPPPSLYPFSDSEVDSTN